MNVLEATLGGLARRLDATATPYMVIGGFANLQWGRPRLTQDLDVTVRADDAHLARLIAALQPEFMPRIAEPVGFARQTGVVPIESATGVCVDLIVASLSLEFEAIARAVTLTIGGTPVRFATAEDLILHKIVSERSRDHEDVAGIVRRQAGALDLEYLRPRISELARALQRPDMLKEFEQLVRPMS